MKIYFELFGLLTLPLILLLPKTIPLSIKGATIVLLVVIIIILSINEKLSPKELGLRTDNLKESLLPYSIFTAIGVVVMILLSQTLHKEPITRWWTYSHLQWAFLPISAVQEFVYRAFAQTKLQKVANASVAILIAAALYSGMHILWKEPLILIMTFIGGIGWGYLWNKHPNLILLTLSHTILNFLVVYLGFFPWLITDFFNLR
jgi:uncharacterized protein